MQKRTKLILKCQIDPLVTNKASRNNKQNLGKLQKLMGGIN